MILCAVDTGVKYRAEAWFQNIGDGPVLYRAALVPGIEPIWPGVSVPWLPTDRLVIECATVRRQDGHTKRKEVDALNRAAGRLGALHPNPTYLKVEEWKGQLSKKVDHERTISKLSDQELLVLKGMKAAQLKHVLDAVGIGLRVLGRR